MKFVEFGRNFLECRVLFDKSNEYMMNHHHTVLLLFKRSHKEKREALEREIQAIKDAQKHADTLNPVYGPMNPYYEPQQQVTQSTGRWTHIACHRKR